MRTFVDSSGQAWLVRITVAEIKLVRGLVGVDLFGLFTDAGKPFSAMLADPVKLVDVLYVLCREECLQRGLSDEDFGRLMAGDTLERATIAFVDSLTDFFPSAATRRAVHEIVGKSRELQEILGRKTLDLIAQVSPTAVADEMTGTLNKLSGSAPESSRSIPGHSPSAN